MLSNVPWRENLLPPGLRTPGSWCMYAMSYNTAPQRREKAFPDLELKQAQKDPPLP